MREFHDGAQWDVLEVRHLRGDDGVLVGDGRLTAEYPRSAKEQVAWIPSPKRRKASLSKWESFLSYYAGFSEGFVESLVVAADLKPGSTVLDPWSGSGTTIVVARRLGFRSIGLDLNPALALVARARTLEVSDAHHLGEFGNEIIRRARGEPISEHDDLLCEWFSSETASTIRAIERAISHSLCNLNISENGIKIDDVAPRAAALYVALFSICDDAAAALKTSNPTWVRRLRRGEEKISVPAENLRANYFLALDRIRNAAVQYHNNFHRTYVPTIKVFDTTRSFREHCKKVDIVISSPPYCTRIDYTSITSIQLAILSPLLEISTKELSRAMTGSVRVPNIHIDVNSKWGETCGEFLQKLRAHSSKASDGYYFKTHADYFDKIFRSLVNISDVLNVGGEAILVVQDSYYKEIRNDIAATVVEMASVCGLQLRQRKDFGITAPWSITNPKSRKYRRSFAATETVLFLRKHR